VAPRCLLYHSLVARPVRDAAELTIGVDLFDAHLAHLAATGRRIVDAGQMAADLGMGAAEPRTVAITFDDGFADNHDLALPVVIQHGITITVFIAANVLTGRTVAEMPARPLDLGRVREMLASNHVTFGCHGASHRRLRGLPPSVLRDEIVGAKAHLEDLLGRAVMLFAYPYGAPDSFDSATRATVRAAGFSAAFTSMFGPNGPDVDPYALRRCRASWVDDLPWFESILDGRQDWYRAYQSMRAALSVLLRGGNRESEWSA